MTEMILLSEAQMARISVTQSPNYKSGHWLFKPMLQSGFHIAAVSLPFISLLFGYRMRELSRNSFAIKLVFRWHTTAHVLQKKLLQSTGFKGLSSISKRASTNSRKRTAMPQYGVISSRPEISTSIARFLICETYLKLEAVNVGKNPCSRNPK